MIRVKTEEEIKATHNGVMPNRLLFLRRFAGKELNPEQFGFMFSEIPKRRFRKNFGNPYILIGASLTTQGLVKGGRTHNVSFNYLVEEPELEF